MNIGVCAQRPQCASCWALIDHGAILLPDDRYICQQCHSTAIYKADDKAQHCYDQVIKTLDWRLGLHLRVVPRLLLVRQDTLARIAQNGGSVNIKLLGLYSFQGNRANIYVIIGLPANLFRETVAHELAHAWLSENASHILDHDLVEGFAEWVGYKVGQCLGDGFNPPLMKEKRDPYGRGLRRMLDLERQGGIAAVIRVFAHV